MPCYYPLSAFQTDSGDIIFAERGKIARSLELPCGQCIGCRLERSRQWAMRCVHEASMYDANCFATLTYDDLHLPVDGSLDYRHFQLFMKRMRKEYGRMRFFMSGEYGEGTWRPHYHALFFGYRPDDLRVYSRSSDGVCLYTSRLFDKTWSMGECKIGDVTFESAAYVARYVVKKVTGPNAHEHYTRVNVDTGEIVQLEPEFAHMSLRPGIGRPWFDKYYRDVLVRDGVVVRGKVHKPPKYYDKLVKKDWPDVDVQNLEYARFLKLGSIPEGEDTVSRLRAREMVTRARLAFKKRGLT